MHINRLTLAVALAVTALGAVSCTKNETHVESSAGSQASATASAASEAVAKDKKGPPPQLSVSRALDAVMVPVNDETRKKYKLKPEAKGVYVLAVKPDGTGARQGLRAGDVIGSMDKRPLVTTTDVDRFVWGMLAGAAVHQFLFDVYRGPRWISLDTSITVIEYRQDFSYTEINTWTSIDSRSWSEFTQYYASDLQQSLDLAEPENILSATEYTESEVNYFEDHPEATYLPMDERAHDDLPSGSSGEPGPATGDDTPERAEESGIRQIDARDDNPGPDTRDEGDAPPARHAAQQDDDEPAARDTSADRHEADAPPRDEGGRDQDDSGSGDGSDDQG